MMEKNIAFCPDCGGEIRFKKVPFIGQGIRCRHCDTNLIVARRSPIELDWVDYDDWEDELDIPPDIQSRFHQN